MSNGLFSSIRISSSGLAGQRSKMDVIAKNLANAETTRTAEGTPYKRQTVSFSEAVAEKTANANLAARKSAAESKLSLTNSRHLAGSQARNTATPPAGVDMRIGEAKDASEFKVIYDPGHPDADEEGYVLMPNVNVITEMVDMMTASRAYEANVAAVQSAKEMFAKALNI
jgi:flagellar basal-body rod protein FlgC